MLQVNVLLDPLNTFSPGTYSCDVLVDRCGFVPSIRSIKVEEENLHTRLGAFDCVRRSVIDQNFGSDRVAHLRLSSFVEDRVRRSRPVVPNMDAMLLDAEVLLYPVVGLILDSRLASSYEMEFAQFLQFVDSFQRARDWFDFFEFRLVVEGIHHIGNIFASSTVNFGEIVGMEIVNAIISSMYAIIVLNIPRKIREENFIDVTCDDNFFRHF